MEYRCFSCEWLSQCHRNIKLLEAGGDGAFVIGQCEEYTYFHKKVDPPKNVDRPDKPTRTAVSYNPLDFHPYNVRYLNHKLN